MYDISSDLKLPACIRLSMHAAMALCLLFGFSACRNDREEAIHQLELRSLKPDASTLTVAVQKQELAVLTLLHRAGVETPEPAPGQPSLLQSAISAGHWPTAEALIPLSAPAVVNHQDQHSSTALDQALAAGNDQFATSLLAAGALPESGADNGAHALKSSEKSLRIFPEIARRLPVSSPVLSASLLRAVASGNERYARILLHQGADPNAAAEGYSALDLACTKPWPEIARLLIKHGADATHAVESLVQAVQNDDPALARLLLSCGAPPEGTTGTSEAGESESPLRLAIRTRRVGIVDLMLQTGVVPNRYAPDAVSAGDTELLRTFFAHSLDPNTISECGDSLLILALKEGSHPLIPVLIKKGANPTTPGTLGQPPIVLAALQKQTGAVAALIDGGADPNQPFLDPIKPEILALTENEHFEKWLKRDKDLTPLMLAASRGDTGMMRVLLDKGAKRGRQSRDWKRYPVQFACDTANIPAAQMLLGRNPESETSRTRVRISLSNQRAYLYKDDKLLRSCNVSTGKRGNRTPGGSFVITDKQVDWVSSIYKVPMPYFMRLSCRDFGMHQGSLPGYPASHGCIRMPRSDVQAFYRVLKIGDPVVIED